MHELCMNWLYGDNPYKISILYHISIYKLISCVVVDDSNPKIDYQNKCWKGIKLLISKLLQWKSVVQSNNIFSFLILCKCKLLIGSQTKYQLCAAFDFFLTSYMTHTLTAVIPKLLARPHIKWNSSWCKFL